MYGHLDPSNGKPKPAESQIILPTSHAGDAGGPFTGLGPPQAGVGQGLGPWFGGRRNRPPARFQRALPRQSRWLKPGHMENAAWFRLAPSQVTLLSPPRRGAETLAGGVSPRKKEPYEQSPEGATEGLQTRRCYPLLNRAKIRNPQPACPLGSACLPCPDGKPGRQGQTGRSAIGLRAKSPLSLCGLCAIRANPVLPTAENAEVIAELENLQKMRPRMVPKLSRVSNPLPTSSSPGPQWAPFGLPQRPMRR